MQASIVIITTAAGKLQDDSSTDSLDPAVSLWLAYAFISVVVSGILLAIAYIFPTVLPAARLSQVTPRDLPEETAGLARRMGISVSKDDNDDEHISLSKKQENLLKAPRSGLEGMRWAFLTVAVGIIIIGWIMFGLGVGWGVHGSVIAGTTGE